MEYYKTVLMPIQVPIGDYCWGDGKCCEYFDNEGGYSSCDLNFHSLKDDPKGRVLKPKECLNLKE